MSVMKRSANAPFLMSASTSSMFFFTSGVITRGPET